MALCNDSNETVRKNKHFLYGFKLIYLKIVYEAHHSNNNYMRSASLNFELKSCVFLSNDSLTLVNKQNVLH